MNTAISGETNVNCYLQNTLSQQANNVGTRPLQPNQLPLPTASVPLTSDPNGLQQYCRDMLFEIRKINEHFHSPPAFSCIFAFIGFLSSIAANSTQNEPARYCDFVHERIRRLKCVSRVAQWSGGSPLPVTDRTWGAVLYQRGRCGLIHNMNLSGRHGSSPQVDFKLTHDPLVKDFGQDYKVHDMSINNHELFRDTEKVEIILNAFDFCDAVDRGIRTMFSDATLCQTISSGQLNIGPVIQLISGRFHP